jgi:serine/threonine-protein kinase
MPIRIGTRFGAYEVTGSLGSGGMGEVYRARDTNLKRDVALKTLPAAVANDADRLARFQREAEVLASLNHPNIAQIYGLERSEGTTALAMELIEGPTLEDRISQGRVPVEVALRIAMQIVDALETAHERGIVHRDLKPANIKLRPDGIVKVLDFGIAKALDPRGMTGPGPAALTTPAITEAGFILGTAAYMSPEQAKGKPVDERADIWAFGCVLYEMLTGQSAFGGEDVTTTLARVLEREPALGALPANVSPAVRRTILLCLEKDSRDRIRHIGDVRLALQGRFEAARADDAIRTVRPLWRRALPFALMAMAVGVLTIALDRGLMREAAPAASAPVSRFVQPLPMSGQLPGSLGLAVAPDGSAIAFNLEDAIYLRRLGDLEAKPIRGTERGARPFFSPDGRWIGFTSGNHLYKVPTTGGIPVDLGQEGSLLSATWLKNGTIVYTNELRDLRQMADDGREVDVLAKPAEGRAVLDPHGVPGTDWVLYSEADVSDLDNVEIVAFSLSTGKGKVVLTGGTDARYVQSGHLLYVRGDALYAAPIDLRTMTVTGAGLPVVDGLSPATGFSRRGNYDVSNRGTLAYLEAGSAGQAEPVWIDRKGQEEPIDVDAGGYIEYAYPRISPDGRRVVLTAVNKKGSTDVVVLDVARKIFVPLANTDAFEALPVWWPDGKRVAYLITLAGVFAKAADGTGMPETVSVSPYIWPEAISADGKNLLLTSPYGGLNPELGHGGIGMLQLEPRTPEIRWILEPPPNQFRLNPALSPDDRWLAYESNENGAGTREIFVRAFPNVADGWQRVSVAGGEQPVWRSDGRELLYLEPGPPRRLMAVAVENGDTLALGKPQRLMDWPYAPGPGRSYDLDPGGQRLVALKLLPAALSNAKPPQLHVVQNWLEELRQLVPTK